jgi:hypothetical protein
MCFTTSNKIILKHIEIILPFDLGGYKTSHRQRVLKNRMLRKIMGSRKK